MKAIIISGMPAAGKTTVANILAKKMGLPAISAGDLFKEMAKERGYEPSGDDWWDTKDGIKFMKERETNPDFDREVDVMLLEKIEKGDIIVTSYTAPWISKQGFKIWLNAKAENRAERMAKRDNTDIKETTRTTKIRDIENYKLYKNLYKMEFGKDLTPFAMVIDTDSITPEQVAEKILAKVKELKL